MCASTYSCVKLHPLAGATGAPRTRCATSSASMASSRRAWPWRCAGCSSWPLSHR
jgi:hypothetical protein